MPLTAVISGCWVSPWCWPGRRWPGRPGRSARGRRAWCWWRRSPQHSCDHRSAAAWIVADMSKYISTIYPPEGGQMTGTSWPGRRGWWWRSLQLSRLGCWWKIWFLPSFCTRSRWPERLNIRHRYYILDILDNLIDINFNKQMAYLQSSQDM